MLPFPHRHDLLASLNGFQEPPRAVDSLLGHDALTDFLFFLEQTEAQARGEGVQTDAVDLMAYGGAAFAVQLGQEGGELVDKLAHVGLGHGPAALVVSTSPARVEDRALPPAGDEFVKEDVGVFDVAPFPALSAGHGSAPLRGEFRATRSGSSTNEYVTARTLGAKPSPRSGGVDLLPLRETREAPPKKWRNWWRAKKPGMHARTGKIIWPGEKYPGCNVWPSKDVAETQATWNPDDSDYLGAFPVEEGE